MINFILYVVIAVFCYKLLFNRWLNDYGRVTNGSLIVIVFVSLMPYLNLATLILLLCFMLNKNKTINDWLRKEVRY